MILPEKTHELWHVMVATSPSTWWFNQNESELPKWGWFTHWEKNPLNGGLIDH